MESIMRNLALTNASSICPLSTPGRSTNFNGGAVQQGKTTKTTKISRKLSAHAIWTERHQ